jgi:nucleoside-diphosphate-sugar epimerase
MKQLGELVARIFSDKGARLVEAEGCKDYADNENQILGLNCSQTREKLSWKPYMELESGIRSLGEWYSHTDDPKYLRELVEMDVQRTIDAVFY